MARHKLTVSFSIDVEEEGLFSGKYDCLKPTVSNISSIGRMKPLISRGVRPTLFCAWSVLKDRSSLQLLGELGENAELGAHLHHWNTPPLVPNIPASGIVTSVPASQVAPELIKSKIKTLQALAEENLGRPFTSFRMGRWDMHRQFLPLLPRRGIAVDASIRPLHFFSRKDKGPNHFRAPSDPYWIYNNRLLEVPLTVVPLVPGIRKLFSDRPWFRKISASARYWGAAPILPVQQPLWLLKFLTNLHVSTGGRVLSLTWHSSEMHPGGAPHMPDEASVRRFSEKMSRYLDWLESSFELRYANMSDLYNSGESYPVARSGLEGDWRHSDA